jgi:hypothetical protein
MISLEKSLGRPWDRFSRFMGAFLWGFGKSACLDVVFRWCKRGGMCRERGEKDALIPGRKTCHFLQIYFSGSTGHSSDRSVG